MRTVTGEQQRRAYGLSRMFIGVAGAAIAVALVLAVTTASTIAVQLQRLMAPR